MKIALGADHAGFTLKNAVKKHLDDLGHEVLDVGTDSPDRTDYPIWGSRAARLVTGGEAELGIVVCGSGIGIGIAANKVPGARCATCTDPWSAHMTRRHNDANMLALGERVTGEGLAMAIVDAFLEASFDGGRHAGRVDQITDLDEGREL
ncbi:ribose 5-phosphate isomerase B [Mobilicoccus caccae]|uniref:Ribose-5-phosphate isomerase n=1 Tax=Mobilicoccus caccae TaxID=1859295 RepID=A0ABQ6IKN6_9MICO|nr:ribose 5-phosphate isomerase B [Mobilicoccus caccae]GMA38254.1 ribose-5-phosphate isomerase [Mobilicoccus caccae]